MQKQKKIERVVENKYGYSHTKTVYYMDGSYEIINLSEQKTKNKKTLNKQ